MSNNGWIKLHRQIVDNWIWEDPAKLKAWLDILLMVNHEDKKILVNGQLVTIKRGEKLTSIIKLAERWKWSKRRVMRFLDLLEDDEMCTTKRTTNGTTIKVVNYADYQDFVIPKRDTVGTTNGTPDGTADGTPPGTQTITNKNYKNDKREGSAPHTFTPPDEQEVRDYCKAMDYKMNVGLFMAYYEARDWCLSHGKKMADWKKAVTAWAIREKSNAGTGVSDMQADEDYKRTQEMLEEYDRAAAEATTFKGSLKREVRKRMNK